MTDRFGPHAAEAGERLRRVLELATQRAEAIRREAAAEAESGLARAGAERRERISSQIAQLQEMRDQLKLGSDELQRGLTGLAGGLYAVVAAEIADPNAPEAAAAIVSAEPPGGEHGAAESGGRTWHRPAALVPALGVAAAGILFVGALLSVLADLDDADLTGSIEPASPRAERASAPQGGLAGDPASEGAPGLAARSVGRGPLGVAGVKGGGRGRESGSGATLAAREAGPAGQDARESLTRPASADGSEQGGELGGSQGDQGGTDDGSGSPVPSLPSPGAPPANPNDPSQSPEPPPAAPTPAPTVPIDQPGLDLPSGISPPDEEAPESDEEDLGDEDSEDGEEKSDHDDSERDGSDPGEEG